MAGRPIWYELMTPDARSVAPFYGAVLRWSIPGDATKMPNGSEYRTIGRSDGGSAGGVLTLTRAMQSGGARPGWLPYFHVDDVDAAVAKATKLDAPTSMPPETLAGVGRIAMLADPQGAPFYLMKPTPPPGKPDAKSDVFDAKKAGHCRWNELLTNRASAAKSFYTSLLGWTIEEKMSMGAAGDYLFIDCANERIGAISPTTKPATRPSWLLYFGVDDIGRAEGAVTANGGKVVQEPREIPGGDHVFVVTDPVGALVGFVGPKKA
jgi:hypothetical protein